MNIKEYELLSTKLFENEVKRLISMGYTEEDARSIIDSSFHTQVTNVLLMQILREVKKK